MENKLLPEHWLDLSCQSNDYNRMLVLLRHHPPFVIGKWDWLLPLHIRVEQLRYIIRQLMDAPDLISSQSFLPVVDIGTTVKFHRIDIFP